MSKIQVLHGYMGGISLKRLYRNTVGAVANTVSDVVGTVVQIPFRVATIGLDAVGANTLSDAFRGTGNIMESVTRYPAEILAVGPIRATGDLGSDIVMSNLRNYSKYQANSAVRKELLNNQSTLTRNNVIVPSSLRDATQAVQTATLNRLKDQVVNAIIVMLQPARDAVSDLGASVVPWGFATVGSTVTRYVWDKTVAEMIGRTVSPMVRQAFEQAIGFVIQPELENLPNNPDSLMNIATIQQLSQEMPNWNQRVEALGAQIVSEGISRITGDDKHLIGFTVEQLHKNDYATWLNIFDYTPNDDTILLYWGDLKKAQSNGFPTFAEHYRHLMARAGQASLAERNARAEQTKALWQSMGYPDYATFVGMTQFVRTYNKPLLPYGEYVLIRQSLGRSQAMASQIASLTANKNNQEFVRKQIEAKKGNALLPIAVGAVALWSVLS